MSVFSLSTQTEELSAGLAALQAQRGSAKPGQGQALPHLSPHSTGLDPSRNNHRVTAAVMLNRGGDRRRDGQRDRRGDGQTDRGHTAGRTEDTQRTDGRMDRGHTAGQTPRGGAAPPGRQGSPQTAGGAHVQCRDGRQGAPEPGVARPLRVTRAEPPQPGGALGTPGTKRDPSALQSHPCKFAAVPCRPYRSLSRSRVFPAAQRGRFCPHPPRARAPLARPGHSG